MQPSVTRSDLDRCIATGTPVVHPCPQGEEGSTRQVVVPFSSAPCMDTPQVSAVNGPLSVICSV
jgi:hypothetical protein